VGEGRFGRIKLTLLGHRREPFQAGTADPLQQERLEAIVQMVRRQHGRRAQLTRRFGQSPVASLARGRLHAHAAPVDAHAPHRPFDAQRCALPLAMLRPGIGIPVQPVMHVHGVRPREARRARLAQPAYQAQQRRGVASAAVGEHQRRVQARAGPRWPGHWRLVRECIVDRRPDRRQQRELQRVSCRPTFP
jgi:hypothetical protein